MISRDVLPAPGKAERVLDVAFDFHDPEQRIIEKLLDLAADQRVEVPELVDFDQVGVVAGEDEVGVVFEEQIGDVAQMDEPVQRRRAEALLLAQLVADQPGGLGQVVDEQRVLGRGLGGVMVNDDPVRPVHARLEGEVGDPAGFLAQVALAPIVVVIGLQANVGIEQLPRQPLQQDAGHQPVEVALVGDDYFRPGQGIRH